MSIIQECEDIEFLKLQLEEIKSQLKLVENHVLMSLAMRLRINAIEKRIKELE